MVRIEGVDALPGTAGAHVLGRHHGLQLRVQRGAQDQVTVGSD
ncbi:hypothetical protein [Micromonospora sp. NPDC048830]